MKLVTDHIVVPMAGERVSGDACLVRTEGERVLLAVIDGLGHGPHAALVANAAVAYLSRIPLVRDVAAMMNGLDEALRGGRGAAAMICVVDAGTLVGCGVGNVELLTIGAKLPVTLTPGIVGSRMHRLRVFEGPIAPGNRLVMYTDGISSGILGGLVGKIPFKDACRTLIDRYRKSRDDSTVLVVDVEPSDDDH